MRKSLLMNIHESPQWYRPEEMNELIETHRQMVVTTRARMFVQRLALPLKDFPLVDERTTETILQTLDDALVGLQLTLRMDRDDRQLTPFPLPIPTPDELTVLYGEEVQTCLSAYMRSAIALTYLAEKGSISFDDLPSVDKVRLDEHELLLTFWNFPLDTEDVQQKISGLREITEAILLDPSPLKEKQLLTVGHFFGTGFQMLQQASTEHLL